MIAKKNKPIPASTFYAFRLDIRDKVRHRCSVQLSHGVVPATSMRPVLD